MLHVICTRLRLDHLSVRVGDGSWRCEEIVKNLEQRLGMRILLLLLSKLARSPCQPTDTGPNNPRANPVTPGAGHGRVPNLESPDHWHDSSGESKGSMPVSPALEADSLPLSHRHVCTRGEADPGPRGRNSSVGSVLGSLSYSVAGSILL